MRKSLYRPRAAFDLESIVVYLGEVHNKPQSAKHLYRAIIEAVSMLCETPTIRHPFCDETLDRQDYRWHLVDQYRIFFTFDDNTLVVYRIIHTRQNIDDYALVEWPEL